MQREVKEGLKFREERQDSNRGRQTGRQGGATPLRVDPAPLPACPPESAPQTRTRRHPIRSFPFECCGEGVKGKRGQGYDHSFANAVERDGGKERGGNAHKKHILISSLRLGFTVF